MGWHTGAQRFGYPPSSTLPYIDMDTPFPAAGLLDSGHTEYEAAFAELERRAARGEFTLAQWRHEVHSLRQRRTGGRPVPLWRRHGNVPA